MTKKINIFIVAHKEIGYELPFPHQIVGMDGFSPHGAISIDSYIPEYMREDRTFASYRASWGILEFLRQKEVSEHEFLGIWSYRSFFGNKLSPDLTRTTYENTKEDLSEPNPFRQFQTPEELKNSWNKTILLDAPDGVELVVTRPLKFPITFAEQYASAHHFDDLMFGIGLAIRLGCINPGFAASVLSQPFFVHGFSGRISLFRELYGPLLLIAEEFYKKFYIKRDGYQARSINFVLERICTIFIMQKLYLEKIPAVTTNLIQISKDGQYVKGH